MRGGSPLLLRILQPNKQKRGNYASFTIVVISLI